MNIGEATVVSRGSSAPAVPYEDGLVVMSTESGRFFRLDDVGRAIWDRIAMPCSLAELVDELARDYDAPRETIAADVTAWVRRMAAASVVHLA